jgi:GNAT superfamily N-acetyltransferase
MVAIVPAGSEDAEEIARLLRRSIIELCEADHGNDPKRYEAWLENKTADNVTSWIGGGGPFLKTIDDRNQIIGVCAGGPDGQVHLNYILPEARHKGVSKAQMLALEAYYADQRVPEIRLNSTETAKRLYASLGYLEVGEIEICEGITLRSFKKAI